MLGLAVEFASNCAGLSNIMLHWLHALKAPPEPRCKDIEASLVGY
jgi:hypothetical protein